MSESDPRSPSSTGPAHPAKPVDAPEQTPASSERSDAERNDDSSRDTADATLEQIGTHPLGSAVGAIGGAVAGAITGIAAGPVGSLAGAVGGAIAGGALGSGGVGGAPVTGPTTGEEPAADESDESKPAPSSPPSRRDV